MTTFEEYLTVEQTANLLETSPTNVYALVRTGILKNINHFGKPIKISKSQIVFYLNQRLPSKFKATYLGEEMKVA